jgi:hypothetical protein
VSLTNVITLALGGGFRVLKAQKEAKGKKVVCFLSTHHPSSLSFSYSAFLGVS